MVDFGLANINDIMKINEKAKREFPVDSLFMSGKQNDEIIMWFSFRVEEKAIEIVDIYADDNDENLLFFCGKAGLNTLDLTGYRNIISKNNEIKDILYKLGFEKKEEGYHLTITDDYFKAGCKRF